MAAAAVSDPQEQQWLHNNEQVVNGAVSYKNMNVVETFHPVKGEVRIVWCHFFKLNIVNKRLFVIACKKEANCS